MLAEAPNPAFSCVCCLRKLYSFSISQIVQSMEPRLRIPSLVCAVGLPQKLAGTPKKAGLFRLVLSAIVHITHCTTVISRGSPPNLRANRLKIWSEPLFGVRPRKVLKYCYFLVGSIPSLLWWQGATKQR